jgi:hypothetical protein
MKSLVPLLLTLPLAACVSGHSSSYLVTVHDRVNGTAIEGATVEVRGPASEVAEAGARSTTDGRGETVLLLSGRDRADLFVTFDGDTERYWFATSRVPRFDAPRDEIEGDHSPLQFIVGPKPDPVWKISVVRVIDRLR